jgi:DNA-binding response OmpR family regulator
MDNIIKVNLTQFTIEYNTKKTPQLTQKEFQIFQSLYEKPDWSLSRSALINNIWQNTHVSQKTFDVHLVSLRRKLSSAGLEILFQAPDTYKIVLPEVEFCMNGKLKA